MRHGPDRTPRDDDTVPIRLSGGSWEPPTETAFDFDEGLKEKLLQNDRVLRLPEAKEPEKPKSKMERFSLDIVPAAFAAGVAAVIFSGLLGLALKIMRAIIS